MPKKNVQPRQVNLVRNPVRPCIRRLFIARGISSWGAFNKRLKAAGFSSGWNMHLAKMFLKGPDVEFPKFLYIYPFLSAAHVLHIDPGELFQMLMVEVGQAKRPKMTIHALQLRDYTKAIRAIQATCDGLHMALLKELPSESMREYAFARLWKITDKLPTGTTRKDLLDTNWEKPKLHIVSIRNMIQKNGHYIEEEAYYAMLRNLNNIVVQFDNLKELQETYRGVSKNATRPGSTSAHQPPAAEPTIE